MRNENIKERMKIEKITDRCVKVRLRGFELVKRREHEYVGRRTLEMAPPGRRRRGRSKQRWIDCVKSDKRAIGAAEEDVHDRTGWRRTVSAAATPQQRGNS